MKRILLSLANLVLISSTLLAQTHLSAEDRSKAIDYLKETQSAYLKVVKGISDEQLNFRSRRVLVRGRMC